MSKMNSRFGQLAIAEVIEDKDGLTLRILKRDNNKAEDATKAGYIDEIDRMLHNGHKGNTLALVRLNGMFKTQTKKVVVTKVCRLDDDGEPIEEAAAE